MRAKFTRSRVSSEQTLTRKCMLVQEGLKTTTDLAEATPTVTAPRSIRLGPGINKYDDDDDDDDDDEN